MIFQIVNMKMGEKVIKVEIKNKDIKKINVYKIILIGDSVAGKTCFLLRCFGERFQELHLTTIGIDFRKKEIQLEESNTVQLLIWDTPGQERFFTFIRNYLPGVDGIILIYDITSIYSFDFVRNWIKKYKENILEKVPVFLVGNKIDKEEYRQVTTEEGIILAKKHGFIFYECSVKSNINIDSIINGILKKINDNYEQIVYQRNPPKQRKVK